MTDRFYSKYNKYSCQLMLQVRSHQERGPILWGYNIRNPNPIVTCRQTLDKSGVEAFGIWEQERARMKSENCIPVPANATSSHSAQAWQVVRFVTRVTLLSEQTPKSVIALMIRTIYEELKVRYEYTRIAAVPCNSATEPVKHKCV